MNVDQRPEELPKEHPFEKAPYQSPFKKKMASKTQFQE